MALLEVENLFRSFGGLLAVQDVSFTVEKGQIKAVIGPNGAGKTTLFNLISRALAPTSGAVRFDGCDLQGKKPHQAASLGMARTFQNIEMFSGMTVLENVMVGCHVRSRSGFLASMFALPGTRPEEREIRKKSLALLDLLGVADLACKDAAGLAFGQQRAVEFTGPWQWSLVCCCLTNRPPA